MEQKLLEMPIALTATAFETFTGFLAAALRQHLPYVMHPLVPEFSSQEI
jgi:hypothetical protein